MLSEFVYLLPRAEIIPSHRNDRISISLGGALSHSQPVSVTWKSNHMHDATARQKRSFKVPIKNLSMALSWLVRIKTYPLCISERPL